MKKLLITLVTLCVITYAVLLICLAENFKQGKLQRQQIDSLKKITNEKPRNTK